MMFGLSCQSDALGSHRWPHRVYPAAAARRRAAVDGSPPHQPRFPDSVGAVLAVGCDDRRGLPPPIPPLLRGLALARRLRLLRLRSEDQSASGRHYAFERAARRVAERKCRLLDGRALMPARAICRRRSGSCCISPSRRLGLNRVEAACLLHNDASRHLLRKLGFKEEGVARRYLCINGRWQDHVMHAILREDPRPSVVRRATSLYA